MRCRVLGAAGLASGGKADPICRLTLKDEWGKTLKTVSTEGKDGAKKRVAPASDAHPGRGPDVEWDEAFLFRGVPNPCLCALSVHVLDARGDRDGGRPSEATLPLGTLAARPGPQDLELAVARPLPEAKETGELGDEDVKVKLQIDNFGSWGNGQPVENRLFMLIKGAVGLPTRVGTLVRGKVDLNGPYVQVELKGRVGTLQTDPYVEVELKGPSGEVLQKKATRPMIDAGSDPQWDEQLVFENIENPAACSIYIACYDDSANSNEQKLGHTELPCGVLGCSSEYTAFDGTTLGGNCKLDFSMHTGGTWGNKEPALEPRDAGGAQGCCCAVM